MKKLSQFLKKNKHTVIVCILCTLLVIFVFVVKFTFFPNEGKAIYGDRLDGMEKVAIDENQKKEIEKSLTEKEEVEKASVSLSGRIINVVITVKEDTSLDAAKALTEIVDSNIEEEQKKYYDSQVFIQKAAEDEKFPIIGYRHQDNDTYSWTKDR